MAEKKLTIKEKAVLYDNWLKYVDNRGWSEVLQEPLKVKAIIDKLKAQIKQLEEDNGNNGITIAHQDSKIKRLKEERDSWESKANDLNPLIEENKKLKEERKQIDAEWKFRQELIDALKQKLEKIKEWANNFGYDTRDGFRVQEFKELKEILNEK